MVTHPHELTRLKVPVKVFLLEREKKKIKKPSDEYKNNHEENVHNYINQYAELPPVCTEQIFHYYHFLNDQNSPGFGRFFSIMQLYHSKRNICFRKLLMKVLFQLLMIHQPLQSYYLRLLFVVMMHDVLIAL